MKALCIGSTRIASGQCFPTFLLSVELSANVCVAHGTLYNDPSVYIATSAYNCGRELRSGNFCLFRRKPWKPLAESWLETLLRNISNVSAKLRLRGFFPPPVIENWRLQACCVLPKNLPAWNRFPCKFYFLVRITAKWWKQRTTEKVSRNLNVTSLSDTDRQSLLAQFNMCKHLAGSCLPCGYLPLKCGHVQRNIV